jgi:RNase H-fold protein (predicted Holliday junction resolvase)
MDKNFKESPKILGLDVSTKTIGWALFYIETKQLLELTHISPVIKEKDIAKMKELFLKSDVFKTKLEQYDGLNIQKVVIEEPLLNSNNVYTIQTLMRYNTLISKEIYDVLGIVPEYISTYNSRKSAFPWLVKENDKGKFVLFGGFPKNCDKKEIIWEQVAKREPQINWSYTKNNTLKKENFDMSDAYCCVLGYMKQQNIWN